MSARCGRPSNAGSPLTRNARPLRPSEPSGGPPRRGGAHRRDRRTATAPAGTPGVSGRRARRGAKATRRASRTGGASHDAVLARPDRRRLLHGQPLRVAVQAVPQMQRQGHQRRLQVRAPDRAVCAQRAAQGQGAQRPGERATAVRPAGLHTHDSGPGGLVALAAAAVIAVAAVKFILAVFWWLLASTVALAILAVAAAVLVRRHYTRLAAAWAEVLAAREARRAVAPPRAAAALPPAEQHVHFYGVSAADVAAILEAHRNEGQH